MTRFTFAFHNIVVHPVCGLLWLIGAQRLGDWLHGVSDEHYTHDSLKSGEQ